MLRQQDDKHISASIRSGGDEIYGG